MLSLASLCVALVPTPKIDVAATHSLLGRHALLLSSALPLERESSLAVADAALAGGASVTLLVPMPESGAAASGDEVSFQLLQHMQRRGHPALMEDMGFAFGGVAGQYGTGNRPRVSFKYVRADDVESLSLALADADVLLLQTPTTRLAPAFEQARFRLQRRTFGFVVRRLRARQIALRRDDTFDTTRLRWAWLATAPSVDEDV